MRDLLVSRFWSPPLFGVQPTLARGLNLTLPPLLWGVFCGLLSGVGPYVFIAGLVLSFLGAFGAGRQQLGAGSGLLRGVAAGTFFGASVLAGHAIAGSGSLMFQPAWLQVAFTAVVGGAFGACGGWSRLREETQVDAALPEAAFVRGD